MLTRGGDDRRKQERYDQEALHVSGRKDTALQKFRQMFRRRGKELLKPFGRKLHELFFNKTRNFR
jgi:hypothetical protein